MNIRVLPTEIQGALIIEPDFFEDERGFFFESYSKRCFEQHGLDLCFVQDNHSRSAQGVLRGFHFQDASAPQWRLIRCSLGEIWDVVVDLRASSPTCGRWLGVKLTAESKRQLLVPPEFAHGFCVLSTVAEVQYKCSNFHTAAAEKTLAWDDPDIAVPWPVENPVLSTRDRESGMRFKHYIERPIFA